MKKTKYYHKNSDTVGFYKEEHSDGFWWERTYDERGNLLTRKDSSGYRHEFN